MLLDNYSKEELQQIIKMSHSYHELAKNLGYKSYSGDLVNSLKTFFKDYDCSHFRIYNPPTKRDETNVFVENSTANQSTLRRWYVKGEYTEYKCSICNQEPVWNNKPLTLILDHINGVNNDDRLENLRWVCPNCNQQLDTTGARNFKRIKHEVVITSASKRCISCANKYKAYMSNSRIQSIISRDELKQLIREKPFTYIGEKYNLTDNAIRKWCKRYNLPSKKGQIESYSDEEWELL